MSFLFVLLVDYYSLKMKMTFAGLNRKVNWDAYSIQSMKRQSNRQPTLSPTSGLDNDIQMLVHDS